MFIHVVLEEIGCYIDTGTRDLEGPYITTTDMTPQKCVRYCNDLQFSYAGVQVYYNRVKYNRTDIN